MAEAPQRREPRAEVHLVGPWPPEAQSEVDIATGCTSCIACTTLSRTLDSPQELAVLVRANLFEAALLLPAMVIHIITIGSFRVEEFQGAWTAMVLLMPMAASVLRLPFVLLMYRDCLRLAGVTGDERLLQLRRLWLEFCYVCPGTSSAISLLYFIAFFFCWWMPRTTDADPRSLVMNTALTVPFLLAALVHLVLCARALAAFFAGGPPPPRCAALPSPRLTGSCLKEADPVPGSVCVICLTELKEDVSAKDPAVSLPCGHSFHRSCIGVWLVGGNGRCPMRCKSQHGTVGKTSSVEQRPSWRLH